MFTSQGKLGGESKTKSRYYGQAIGILITDTTAPLIPGNVGNASTFNFPVRIEILKDVDSDWFFQPPSANLQPFIEGVKRLEREGLRAITTGCGLFAIYQNEATNAVNIPVFTSPLMLVPLIHRMLGKKAKIGILTASAKCLGKAHLEGAGIDESIPLVIGGMDDAEEFNKVIVRAEKLTADFETMEKEILTVAENMARKSPGLGAIVLECADMPPFAAAIQEKIHLPTFDFIDFIKLVYSAVVKKKYVGFM